MSTIKPPTNILRYKRRHPLDVFFAPANVAVIGATEKTGSVGRTVLHNLIENQFGGTVFPINPKRPSVLGIKAYPKIAEVPDKVELAVIVTAAPMVPDIVGECVEAGIKGAIIISAGFKEIGKAGEELEHRILAQARRGNMRVIGPNCLGLMSPQTGFNATFAGSMARPGNVGFISQSGALCTAVLDWSHRENVGFSAFVSIGSMLDVNWGDLIDYLGDDPRTKSIVIYMETIGDARSFLSAAREVALAKPIIVIKPGRTEGAAKAAASHTGSLTGSDEVLDAAFHRCGVLRVNTIAELFYMAEALSKQPSPQKPCLTILTNAGGPGVLATDALITNGGELAPLSEQSFAELNALLPPHWSRNNPIDILGDADPDRYAKAFEIAAKDPNSNGLLVILTPQAMTNPTATAQELVSYASSTGKPVLAAWMGGVDVAEGEIVLNQANIPTYPYPDTAARVFTYLWRYHDNLRNLYETPIPPDDPAESSSARARADLLIRDILREGRTLLSEFESKQLLAAYAIPTTMTKVAATEEEAAIAAQRIGYPVVLKLHSKTLTHKTDVGGVQLNLNGDDDVRHAFRAIESSVREKAGDQHFLGVTVQPMVKLDGYEIIIGSSNDPQFGPVLLFGSGGQLVEVYKDRSLALPPLNTTLAQRMMERTRIYKALKGVRGRRPVDLVALEQILVQFSRLVVEQRRIKEIDINPLIASDERIVALDARVLLHEPGVDESQLPKLAIRPYPVQYVSQWKLDDETPVVIRPIRPEDEPSMVKFHQTLSDRSVYLRYFHMINLTHRIAHERLTRICFIDYEREMALVAERKDPATGESRILGVARISKLHGTNDAEFALLISDTAQGIGLGAEMLRRLVEVARKEKIGRIVAEFFSENAGMNAICAKLGFAIEREPGSEFSMASLAL